MYCGVAAVGGEGDVDVGGDGVAAVAVAVDGHDYC